MIKKIIMLMMMGSSFLGVLNAGTIVYKLDSVGSYTFKPNQPVEITNPLFWSASVNCLLSTHDKNDTLYAKMLSGQAKVNGQSVGSGLSITIKNGDDINISAGGFAKTQITNKGESDVNADCS